MMLTKRELLSSIIGHDCVCICSDQLHPTVQSTGQVATAEMVHSIRRQDQEKDRP